MQHNFKYDRQREQFDRLGLYTIEFIYFSDPLSMSVSSTVCNNIQWNEIKFSVSSSHWKLITFRLLNCEIVPWLFNWASSAIPLCYYGLPEVECNSRNTALKHLFLHHSFGRRETYFHNDPVTYSCFQIFAFLHFGVIHLHCESNNNHGSESWRWTR